ncbi:hypothetical protein Y1Q_0021222 [Alligator mississippiensis]|uniref:Uncharacterized protein n=1 Tax=Alligator mississippiensis TaxID=8496 RepID=A0A151MS98_ALLMI|nr:hypothetical protein Y1Q_0021222 [Alligator mississippiensis]
MALSEESYQVLKIPVQLRTLERSHSESLPRPCEMLGGLEEMAALLEEVWALTPFASASTNCWLSCLRVRSLLWYFC